MLDLGSTRQISINLQIRFDDPVELKDEHENTCE